MPRTRKPRQSNPTSFQWEPAKFLTPFKSDYVLLVLNQPLENRKFFLQLSRQAELIICADGGANRVKDLNLSKEEELRCRIHAICGDLDSLRPDVRSYYEDTGTVVVRDPDQNSTDIQKCLQYLQGRPKTRNSMNGISDGRKSPAASINSFDIAIVGGLGGRADQAFSQLHHLYTANKTIPDPCTLYLITSESIIFLLQKGINLIHAPTGPDLLGENVGIIPLGRPSIITIRGLEWDVVNWQTEFGTQISTSNHIKKDRVTVETSEKVLFTVELGRSRIEEDRDRSAKQQRTDSNEAETDIRSSSELGRSRIDEDRGRPAKRRRIDSNVVESYSRSLSDLSGVIGGRNRANSNSNNKTNGSASFASNGDIASRLDRLEQVIRTVSKEVPSKIDRLEQLIKSLTEEVSTLAKQDKHLLE